MSITPRSMSSTTNSLVSLALLGTPGRAVACPLPELQAEWEKIQQGSEDSEEAFYRLAAMVFAYRRAGLLPEEQEVSYPLTEPLEETQPFLPQEPSLILRSLLSNRLTATLAYGLDLVAEEGLILRPEYVYELLSTVLKKGSGYNVACRANALKVSGNRGKWLLPLLDP